MYTYILFNCDICDKVAVIVQKHGTNAKQLSLNKKNVLGANSLDICCVFIWSAYHVSFRTMPSFISVIELHFTDQYIRM